MANDSLEDVVAALSRDHASTLVDSRIERGELTLSVERRAIADVLTFLRDDAACRFEMLIDLCGVDYPERPQRFDVVYHLLSVTENQRVRVRLETDEDSPVPSVAGVYSVAGWFEREAWDLFGIFFSGNPDLRRLLTDYGFEGHPLRKDFPLTGYVEVRYDETEKRVVYEPVKLTQDFRRFEFMSPWEGMTDIMLPGDDKAVQPKHGSNEEAAKAASAMVRDGSKGA